MSTLLEFLAVRFCRVGGGTVRITSCLANSIGSRVPTSMSKFCSVSRAYSVSRRLHCSPESFLCTRVNQNTFQPRVRQTKCLVQLLHRFVSSHVVIRDHTKYRFTMHTQARGRRSAHQRLAWRSSVGSHCESREHKRMRSELFFVNRSRRESNFRCENRWERQVSVQSPGNWHLTKRVSAPSLPTAPALLAAKEGPACSTAVSLNSTEPAFWRSRLKPMTCQHC